MAPCRSPSMPPMTMASTAAWRASASILRQSTAASASPPSRNRASRWRSICPCRSPAAAPTSPRRWSSDASKHPWANLPVTLVLTVEDGLGQGGQSEAQALVLPGRRFFDPVAAAVIEMRRDLLWTRDNAPSGGAASACADPPARGAFAQRARLSDAARGDASARQRGGAGPAAAPACATRCAEALWEIAMLIEDGGLDDALDRMTAGAGTAVRGDPQWRHARKRSRS